jgi:uncharacterized protein
MTLEAVDAMQDMDEKKAVELLKKYSSGKEAFEKVLGHSKAVQKLALEIASKIAKNGTAVDMEFIRDACILHDIGRFTYPPGPDSVKHGVAGADILRKEGVNEQYALVCERHLGSGISRKDVEKQKIPIPAKDYLPKSVEEKIISYADNLLWGDRRVSVEKVVERFTKELGAEYGEKVKAQHREISALMGK